MTLICKGGGAGENIGFVKGIRIFFEKKVGKAGKSLENSCLKRVICRFLIQFFIRKMTKLFINSVYLFNGYVFIPMIEFVNEFMF